MFRNKPNLNEKITENRIWYHWARKKYAGNQKHTFHIVTRSPWPLYSSIGALSLTVGMAMYMHNYMFGGFMVFQSIVLLSIVLYLWWRDVVREGNLGGYHTQKVQQGLRYGMILFIVSEIMFFFSFFWAFFHSSLSPSIALGSVWPPIGINVLDPLQIPLLNTFILLLSGLTVTWSHNVLREEDWQEDFFVKTTSFDEWLKLSDKKIYEFEDNFYQCAFALLLTIFLGFVFTLWQGYEYYKATFYINDGIYGSVFYMTTGLHGLHVIIGTIFLVVCFFRLIKFHYSWNSHFGFEAAIWYWHFVDVVWIFVFLSIYCWGSGLKMFK